MPGPPSGTVTFLFTDLEGSTVLWERHAAFMDAALGVHDEIMRQRAATHGGYIFATGERVASRSPRRSRACGCG
jgi:class 3 adenylate cyclase